MQKDSRIIILIIIWILLVVRFAFSQNAGSRITGGGGGSTSPGGNDTEIQFNNAGAFGGANYALIKDSTLTVLKPLNSIVPSNGIKITYDTMAQWDFLKYTGAKTTKSIQNSMVSSEIGYYLAVGDSTNNTSTQNLIMAQKGTGIVRTIVPYSLSNSVFREEKRNGIRNTGTTSGNNLCGLLNNSKGPYFISSSNTSGGFFIFFSYGISEDTFKQEASYYVGLKDSVNTGNFNSNNDPANFINFMGIGASPNDTNMYFFHNDSLGVASKINLGPGFRHNSSNVDWYEFTIYNPRGEQNIYFRVFNKTTGDIFNGMVNSDIPSIYQTLIFTALRNSVTVVGSSRIVIDFGTFYYEKPVMYK